MIPRIIAAALSVTAIGAMAIVSLYRLGWILT